MPVWIRQGLRVCMVVTQRWPSLQAQFDVAASYASKMILILAGRTPRFDAMSFMVPSGTVSNMLHTAPHDVDAAALRQCERKKSWARQADAVNFSDMSHCHHWLRSTSINPP